MKINFVSFFLLVAFSSLSFGEEMMFKYERTTEETANRYAKAKNIYIVHPLTPLSTGEIEVTDVLKGEIKPHKYNCEKESLFLMYAKGRGFWLITSNDEKDICRPDYLDHLVTAPVLEALEIAVNKKNLKLNKGYSLKRIKKIAEKSDFKFKRIVETGPIKKKSNSKKRK